MALPGFIDRSTGRVIATENVQWFDVEVGETFRRDLDIPLHFANGAKPSALAEMWPSPEPFFTALTFGVDAELLL